jgi:hypothetical protein
MSDVESQGDVPEADLSNVRAVVLCINQGTISDDA